MRQAVRRVRARQPPSTTAVGRLRARACPTCTRTIGDADELQEARRAARPHRPRARHRRQPAVLPLDPAAAFYAHVVQQLGAAGLIDGRRRRAGARVIIEKPFGATCASAHGAQRRGAQGPRRGRRSTASTTTSARRRCRTSSSSASPTRSSSRCGTASTSTTCRSPAREIDRRRGPRRRTTRAPARCAT